MKSKNRRSLFAAGRLLACSLAVMFVAFAGLIEAQESASRTVLPDHTPPQLGDGTAVYAGRYQSMGMLRLALALRSPHPAEEEQLVREIGDPTSPHYRHFLSPEECIARFSPSAEDEQAVVDWARSQGLTVTHRYPNRLLVDVEAPSGVIERVFAVTMNQYRVGAELEYSNDRDPAIPASLAPVLGAVMGLNNIQRMEPAMVGASRPVFPDYNAGPVIAALEESHGPDGTADAEANLLPVKPEISNNHIDPSDVYSSQMYNYGALAAVDHCCNPHNDANGSPAVSSIALATWGLVNYNDTNAFFKQFGLNWNLSAIGIDNPGSCSGKPADCYNDETTLDTEWSTATSNYPASWKYTAHVYIYSDGSWGHQGNADMYNQMLTDNHARVFSTSWSCTENYGCSKTDISYWHGIFNKMVLQGWTLMAASGDRGASDDCSWNKKTSVYNSAPHTSVSYPASDPDVIAVGGTAIHGYIGSGNAFIWTSEPAWQGGTGWGSCGGNGGGSGGGVSTIFSQPGYQSGLGGSMRLVPDISLNSGGVGQNFYYAGEMKPIWGTSIAAPEIAGFFARENSYLNYIGDICGANHNATCTPIGDPHGALYFQGMQKTNHAGHNPFYDITSGCNSNDATRYYNLNYYCAGKGYDKVTGWGAANMLQLAWSLNWLALSNYANGIPYVTFKGPATNKWYNTNQTVSWTINDYSGGKGTHPAGIAGFTQGWDTIPSDPTSEPNPGSGNSFYSGPEFTTHTGCLSLVAGANGCSGGVSQGCHTVKVHGWNNEGWTTAGQAGFPESYGPICYDTIAPVSKASLAGTPVNGVGYESAVTVTLSATDASSGVQATYFTLDGVSVEIYMRPVTIYAAGNHTLRYWSKDVAGNTERANTVSFNIVTPTVTGLSVTPNPALSGATVTLKATVAAMIAGNTPTGTVTFYHDTTAIGSAALTAGTATLTVNNLPIGTDILTVQFPTSGSYLASTSSGVREVVAMPATASRVVWVPDFYGQALEVRVGSSSPVAITVPLPSTCYPNSVAVSANKAYVACNAFNGTSDAILVYNASAIRSAAAGKLTVQPIQTITSSEFNSLIDIVFDRAGNLWVTSYGNDQVDEIPAAQLSVATPAITASLVESPSAPVALAFDSTGLWVTGQYSGGILLHFPTAQLGRGLNALPDYCLATTNVGSGCQSIDNVFLSPEGLALFGNAIWVANNATGLTGATPARELVSFTAANGTLTQASTYGSSSNTSLSPLVCPGGLFAGSVHLWVNDESYGESSPACGANGDVAAKTGGVFDFTAAQLAQKPSSATGVLAWADITGRPGFGGIFVENDQ